MMKIMKKTVFLFVMATMFMLPTSILAQRGQGYGPGKGMGYRQGACQMIPNLTPEQSEQIEALRVAHLKEMQQYRNKVRENRARYQTLMTTGGANPDEINANIDEFTALKNKMMKERTAHQLDIRSLLNEDQKVYFDQRAGKGRKGMGRMQGGKGMRGTGAGPYCPWR
jgi:Spy/CpxP family protein refolding chaperone